MNRILRVALPLALILATGGASSSTCYGTPAQGRLQGGVPLPAQGQMSHIEYAGRHARQNLRPPDRAGYRCRCLRGHTHRHARKALHVWRDRPGDRRPLQAAPHSSRSGFGHRPWPTNLCGTTQTGFDHHAVERGDHHDVNATQKVVAMHHRRQSELPAAFGRLPRRA